MPKAQCIFLWNGILDMKIEIGQKTRLYFFWTKKSVSPQCDVCERGLFLSTVWDFIYPQRYIIDTNSLTRHENNSYQKLTHFTTGSIKSVKILLEARKYKKNFYLKLQTPKSFFLLKGISKSISVCSNGIPSCSFVTFEVY